MTANGVPISTGGVVPRSFLCWVVRRGILDAATEEEMNALATLFLPGNGRRQDESADDFRARLVDAGADLLRERSN